MTPSGAPIDETIVSAMRRALALASRGPAVGDNPQVGCVLLDANGTVVAEGWHRGAGTAHAEVDALAQLADARGLTAVVTLEPCNHTGRTGPCAQALIDAGVSRVVVGSLAVTQPNDVAAWLKGFGPERITLALDVKIEDGVPVPALKGWTQSSETTLWEALDRYPKGTAKHLLVTDVGRDGALTGPNLELLAEIRRRRPDVVLQASGGISSLDDLVAVKALGCNGAIVGRALYENRFTLPQAIAAATA